MPKLSDPSSAPPIRALIMGNSGTGKTGALAPLALAGFSLYIADFDNGIEILRNVIKAKDSKALERVDFEVCRDDFKVEGNFAVPVAAKAWGKGIKYLESVLKQNLGPRDIICVDSLSFAARAAMIYTLHLNGRLKQQPYPADWGEAQRLVELLVQMLSADLECHVICTTHIAQTGGKRIEQIGKGPTAERIVIDEGPIKQLPSMIGKAINPVIPRYFNHMLLAHRVGTGPSAKRVLHTTTFDDIELKNTNPGIIKPEYQLATGLADYFRDAGHSV